MDDQGCPRCKTTKYRNPSLKLMVNVCGHSLCESCVDLLFIKGSGSCPECGTALRRSNFRVQLFEDPYIEKEVDIRKRILRDFNKKEEDFSTLEEYNDYLEMIETIVFNLTNNIDVEETKKMIEQYRKENKDQIQKGKSKLSKDEEYLDQLIEQEQMETEYRRKLLVEEEQREKAIKKKNKEALIDELMYSERSAKDILSTHKADIENQPPESTVPRQAATAFSTGIKLGMQQGFMPIPQEEYVESYRYSPIHMELEGPDPPTHEEILTQGYLSNIRSATDQEKGGGYDSYLACQRAMLDAVCGLFYVPDTFGGGSSKNQT